MVNESFYIVIVCVSTSKTVWSQKITLLHLYRYELFVFNVHVQLNITVLVSCMSQKPTLDVTLWSNDPYEAAKQQLQTWYCQNCYTFDLQHKKKNKKNSDLPHQLKQDNEKLFSSQWLIQYIYWISFDLQIYTRSG